MVSLHFFIGYITYLAGKRIELFSLLTEMCCEKLRTGFLADYSIRICRYVITCLKFTRIFIEIKLHFNFTTLAVLLTVLTNHVTYLRRNKFLI